MKIKKLIGLLILTSSILLTSCGIGPAVKELKKVNDETARYWIQFIKKNGINAIDQDGDILIVWAAKYDNTALVKACIKAGANVNALNKRGYTAVCYTVANNNVEATKALINKKAVVISDEINIPQMTINSCNKEISDEIYDLIFKAIPAKYLDGNQFDFVGRKYPSLSSKRENHAVAKITQRLMDNNYKAIPEDINYYLTLLSNYSENNDVFLAFVNKYQSLIDYKSAIHSLYWSNSNTEETVYKLFKTLVSEASPSADTIKEIAYNIKVMPKRNEKVDEILNIMKNNNWNLNEMDLANDIYEGYFVSKIRSVIKYGNDSDWLDTLLTTYKDDISFLITLLNYGVPLKQEYLEDFQTFVNNYWE